MCLATKSLLADEQFIQDGDVVEEELLDKACAFCKHPRSDALVERLS